MREILSVGIGWCGGLNRVDDTAAQDLQLHIGPGGVSVYDRDRETSITAAEAEAAIRKMRSTSHAAKVFAEQIVRESPAASLFRLHPPRTGTDDLSQPSRLPGNLKARLNSCRL